MIIKREYLNKDMKLTTLKEFMHSEPLSLWKIANICVSCFVAFSHDLHGCMIKTSPTHRSYKHAVEKISSPVINE